MFAARLQGAQAASDRSNVHWNECGPPGRLLPLDERNQRGNLDTNRKSGREHWSQPMIAISAFVLILVITSILAVAIRLVRARGLGFWLVSTLFQKRHK